VPIGRWTWDHRRPYPQIATHSEDEEPLAMLRNPEISHVDDLGR
jgi:hypothetical protein